MATELNRVVTELIIDARGSVAGAAQAVRASKEAELATNKLSDAEERAYIARKKQEGAYIGVSTSLARVRAEYTNLQAKMDPVFAAQTRHQKELERAVLVTDAAVRRGVTTEQQAAATIARLRQQQIRDLQAVKDATQDVIRVQRAANSNVPGMNTANIAAQMQDVAVTSVAGMSPLQIALQQGTQLQAVLGPMGATGAVKALGAAFLSLINPVSLVTLGLVAGTAALIQYFSSGKDEAEAADAALKAHEESIRALKSAYGEAASGLEEYASRSKVVAEAMAISAGFQLKDELEAFTQSLVNQGALIQVETDKIKARMQELTERRAFSTGDPAATVAINKELAELQSQLEITASSALTAADRFAPFRQEILAFGETVKAGKPDFIALQEAIARIVQANPNNEELARLNREINSLIEKGVTFQSGMQANADAIKSVGDEARASTTDLSGFSRAISELATIALPALSDSERAQQALNKALAEADKIGGADGFLLRKDALAEFAKTMQRIRNEIEGGKVPLPTPRPNDIEMWDEAGDAIDKAAAKVEQAKSRAAGLIEKFFPGEAARREAHELIALLEQFGGQLDDMQRKAVEMRIDETLKAAALGMRDLGNETKKARNDLTDMEKDARRLEDALKDAASNFLQDLFTGKDILQSIVQLGSRFASMNFDAFTDAVFGKDGGFFSGAKAKAAGKALGTQVVETIKSSADKWAGLREVNVGGNMAGSVGAYSSARATGAAMATAVSPVLSKTLNPIGVEISKAAKQLGVSARDLGTLISYETGGTFSTSKWGGKNGNYLGLIQFGPEEREKFGAYWGQAFGDQMQAAVRYFKARGLQPGMGIRDLYSTILTGSPGNYNRSDGFGTVDQHLTRMAGHQANADKVLAGIPDAVREGATDGTKTGAAEGVPIGIQKAATGTSPGSGGGFGLQGFAGLLGAGLGGFSTGYQSANPGMGLLGGAVQGLGAGMQLASLFPAMAASLPVIGVAVGAVAGLLGGILGARNKVKQARRELEKNMAQINGLLDVGFGRGMGNLKKQIADFNAEADKAVPLAWKAKRMDLVDEIHASQRAFFTRLSKQFYDSFDETFAAYGAGLGLDSPIMKGAKAMGDLREELRNFIADTRYFGEIARDNPLNETNKQWWLENHGQEVWENEVRRQQELFDRTMAQATSSAIKMILAMVGGAEEFTEYESAVMAVKGAIDVAQSALEELGVEAKMAAAALDKQLNAALKKLQSAYIDDVSRSLYDLADVGYMGDLLDAQKRYNDRLRDAAALGLSADLANRELALSLRNIVREAKLTDDQIRQLAAAMPELSGALTGLIGMGEGIDTGQALADAQAKVEEAKAALRSAYEKERSEIESTISRLKSFTEGIRNFKDSLKLDKELSPLDASERLAEAQRQFQETAAKAMGTGPGAEAAQGRLEEVARAYLEEARAYYGSNEMYYAVWQEVNGTLDQALAKAESQLSMAQKQLSALEKQVKGLIDVDDSVKSVSEAIKDLKAAQAEEASAQAADDAYKNSVFAEMLAVLKAQLAAQNAAAAAQQAAQDAAKATYSSDDPIAKLYRQYLHREPDAAGYAFFSGNLNSGKASLADIEAAIKKEATGMATGGWVTGGIRGMDSVLRMLMPGEFVMPAQMAQRYRPEIEAMHVGRWSPAANDNSALIATLQASLRDMAAELEALRAIVAQGFSASVASTDRTAGAMEQRNRHQAVEARRKGA